VALVCTSGTAALNFGPAVAEAFYSRVPLVVLTADRPPELRGVGANQTIDQVRLYGGHVKWSEEIMLPEASSAALRYAQTMAARAVATATLVPKGPVHLNMPFREPLVPSPLGSTAQNDESPASGHDSGGAAVAVSIGKRILTTSALTSLQARVRGKGLIVCGGGEFQPDFANAVSCLARALGAPVLADALSGVRCGGHIGPEVIASFDSFLRDKSWTDRLEPDFVLRFGAPPVSKSLNQFLEMKSSADQIVIGEGEDWLDPDRTADLFVQADALQVCDELAAWSSSRQNDNYSQNASWLRCWQKATASTEAVMGAYFEEHGGLSEPRVVHRLAQLMPANSVLFAGNSMPVRDVDSFLPATKKPLTVLANRGASGIDGVVSSALGAAAATDRPVVLLIGDLSFYHDMNGLFAAGRHNLSATVVLVNNDGGGIFSFLPQAANGAHFEELFGTPHGLDFRHAAALYSLAYACPESVADFDAAVLSSLATPGVGIIEVKTDRTENVAIHNEVWAKVEEALSGGIRL
jgi:2-succinyl-5-enolpyruvyl-6-hydroxy-3-cyclohexene-1-carboxylate synthase